MKTATTLGSLYAYGLTPAEAVTAAAGSGFRYIDYSFYNCCNADSPFMADDDSIWRKTVADAAAAAAAVGVKYVQAHTPNYNPAGECDHEACLRAVRRSIEACGILGIPNAVIHTSYSRQHLYPGDRDAYFEYNREFLRKLLPVAEKYGVTVCVENSTSGNMQGMYFFMTAGEMNDFIAYMNHPLIGACWDTGHALIEGKSDQYADLVELGSNLKAVHIHDNNGADNHLNPYAGSLQLDSIMKGLLDISFPGYFTFEADSFISRCNGSGPLSRVPLDIHLDGIAMLYKIGRHALETYGCFEK